MKPFLKVRIYSDDNGELHYGLQASSGSSMTSQDFYGYRDDFEDFASGLRDFASSPRDEAKLEFGGDSPKCAYYVLLRAFCFDSVGHSALEICTSSPISAPHGHREHFFIHTEPAALNHLGRILNEWTKKEKSEIEWNP